MFSPIYGIVARLIGRFVGERRGGTAIIFAFSLIPCFGFVAFAIDYGIALAGKAKLDAASDAASMAALTTTQTALQNGASSSVAIAAGVAAGNRAFAANAGSIGFTAVPVPSTMTITRNPLNPQMLTATVAYQTQATTTVMKMLGIKSTPMQGTSTATATLPTYINYYILVDISQSMGVAATSLDMQNLYNRVVLYQNWLTPSNQVGCVFGCHVKGVTSYPNGTPYTQPYTNESLAHNPLYGTPITLRIDSARTAVQSIVGAASTANLLSGSNLISIGLYTMQEDPSTPNSYLKSLVSPPSSNFTAMLATNGPVANMDLGPNVGGGQGDSDFTDSINTFVTNILGYQGDGSSPSKALNYVFIVTDGLSDVPNGCVSCHAVNAFNDSVCTQLQSKATVGVIYTTYNPIYNNNNPLNGYQSDYAALVAPVAPYIPINLAACATNANLYFEAVDGPAILTAMTQLFQTTSQQARISR